MGVAITNVKNPVPISINPGPCVTYGKEPVPCLTLTLPQNHISPAVFSDFPKFYIQFYFVSPLKSFGGEAEYI